MHDFVEEWIGEIRKHTHINSCLNLSSTQECVNLALFKILTSRT